MKSTSFILKSLSKICFERLLEMNEIKIGIEFLLMSFCSDIKFEEKKNNQLEKLFQIILVDGLKESFYEIFELPTFIFEIYPNLMFLHKLILFNTSLKVMIYLFFILKTKFSLFRLITRMIWSLLKLKILMKMKRCLLSNSSRIALLIRNALKFYGCMF